MVNLKWPKNEYEAERGGASWAQKEREAEGARRGGLGFSNGDEKTAERNEAAADLRGAEDNATAGADDDFGASREGGLYNVASSEERADGLFTGAGRDRKDKKGKKKKGFLKRKGPMGLILALVLGAGGMMGGMQLLQPFSLVAQFQETFNSMHTSTKLRSNSFLRYQMKNSGRVADPIKAKIFGGDTFKITNRQAKRLAAQGIEYDDDYDGNGTRVLKFDDGSGDIKIVTADVDTAKKIGGNAMSFDEIYESNPDFYNGYNKGSMTWRGAISNWFGTVTVKFLQSNKITRNLFKNFQEEAKARNDGNTKAAALELIAKGSDEITEGGYKMTGVEKGEGEVVQEPVMGDDGKPVIGENGEPVTRPVYQSYEVSNVDEINMSESNNGRYKGDNELNTVGSGKTNRSELNTEAGVRTKLSSIAGSVQKGANIACTVFNVVGAVSLLVTASEALQIINLVTSYLEAIDKVKAGSNDSPINELASALNEKKSTTHTVITNGPDTWDDNRQAQIVTENGISTLSHEDVSSNKSAMEASGITALYGGGAVNPKDPSVQSFNFTSSIKRILGGLGTSVGAFEACAIAKIASNTVSAIGDAVSVASCIAGAIGAIFTFGATAAACGPLVAGIVKGVALSVAIGVAVAGVISAITPTVASMLTRDLISDIGGEDLGNALTSGANMYMGNTHRANGGSLANVETYTAYLIEHQEVIADDAKYERQTRNPFDATSKNTFFGLLANNMMRLASANSVMNAITSIGSTVSSSIVALSPTATAYNVVESLPTPEEYEETCPYLASIGAVGDAYCNPYSITDMSTINKDPLDVVDKISEFDSEAFLVDDTSDGNVKINPKSDLAKYIVYCDNRTSLFGIADQNIISNVSDWGNVNVGNSFANNALNSAIGAIPIIGDVIDVVDSKDALNNLGYITGESCVAGNNVDRSESPNWDKAKYYQRFIEDQSLAETIGLFGENGKSAVAVFLDEYYEENPLDNSYEGILARYSGLQKDTVVAVLDFVDYYNYIAQYDASERYAFGAPVVEMDNNIMFESEDVMAGEYILINNIVYADVRNRVALV